MMYSITFNNPGEPFPTVVSVTEQQMAVIAGSLNEKRVIQINGDYYYTAYFVKAVKNVEANIIKASQEKLIERGIADSEEETRKRIELTRKKYETDNARIGQGRGRLGPGA